MRKRKPDQPSSFTAFGLSSKRSRAGETVPEPTESQAVAGSSSSHNRSSELSPVESRSSTVESSTARTFQSDKTSVLVVKWWYYRKRGSASYIVREVLSVRERERDRERKTEVTSPLSR